MTEIDIPIRKVKVGDRVRADVGDIKALAASIRARGLIHPIVLNTRHELIVGYRRLKAAELNGDKKIRARVVSTYDDAQAAILAERDENDCRKGFTVKESVEMGRRVEALLRPTADQNRRENLRVGNLPARAENGKPKPVGTVREAAAAAAGMSPHTYERARAVREAAEANPEEYQDLAEEIEKPRKVNAAYKELKKRQEPAPKKPTAAQQLEVDVLCAEAKIECALVAVKELKGRFDAGNTPSLLTNALSVFRAAKTEAARK